MYKKIFLNIITVLIAGITVLSIMTYVNTKNIYFDTVEDTLVSNARLIANRVNSNDQLKDIDKVNNIHQFSNLTDARLTIIGKDGIVLYDSDENAAEMENHGNRQEVINALSGVLQREIRYSNTLKIDMMYVAVPIKIDEEIAGIVRVSIPLKDLRPIIIESIQNIFISILFSLIIALILSHGIIRNITRPLKETTRFAGQIAQGNYSDRLRMIRNDEIGVLSRSLNHMARQLEYSFKELSQRNNELESVMSNINNGIIAIDENHNILLINDSAYRMFNLSPEKKIIGKNILEVIRTHDLYQAINGLNFSDESELRLIETSNNDHIYRVYMNPMKESHNDKGFIIVIEDITQIKRLENVRRDFVANVSHELKTPITSIKGFIETLKEGSIQDDDTRKRFYNIIEFEVNRLIRLVEDILTLSHLDSQPVNNISLDEYTYVHEEMHNIYYLMEKISIDKEVELIVEIHPDLEKIPFNQQHFKHLMINLIDNAIKYNHQGGLVKIQIYPEEKDIIIQVMDNGFGIPKRDLPRIFERFYRVDKGRSSQAGGTGLGLAIVKHILQIENSTIAVDSKFGKGTTFKITVPRR
ncbi:MAG: ATP-binding protein [Eubacteriales bacterium]